MEQSNALAALSALSHATRLSVFRLLVTTGPDGLPAGDIAQAVDVRSNTLSNHLALLATAGLVRSSRDGRIIRYAANYQTMQELLGYLIQDCCNGDASICAPLGDVLAACTSCPPAKHAPLQPQNAHMG
jgi:DNA-binding transcriptional ArsR family regulator